jgi:hypothetical protein
MLLFTEALRFRHMKREYAGCVPKWLPLTKKPKISIQPFVIFELINFAPIPAERLWLLKNGEIG